MRDLSADVLWKLIITLQIRRAGLEGRFSARVLHSAGLLSTTARYHMSCQASWMQLDGFEHFGERHRCPLVDCCDVGK